MVQPASSQPLRFMSPPEARRAMRHFLARWFPETGDFLDVGCGAGDFVAFATERGLRASGIDLDASNVNRARDRGLDVVAGNVLCPPIDVDRLYDVIIMEHLIEHFQPEDAAGLMAEYGGRLRPGGRLIIVTPNYADWTVMSEIFWLDPTHVRPYPSRLLASMLADLGLQVVHTSAQRRARIGLRSAIRLPIGRMRFGRNFQRMNLVVVAERS